MSAFKFATPPLELAQMATKELRKLIKSCREFSPRSGNRFEQDMAAGCRMSLPHAEAELYCRAIHPEKPIGYYHMHVQREGHGPSPAMKMAWADYDKTGLGRLEIIDGFLRHRMLTNESNQIVKDCPVAQTVEQTPVKGEVAGSNPAGAANIIPITVHHLMGPKLIREMASLGFKMQEVEESRTCDRLGHLWIKSAYVCTRDGYASLLIRIDHET